MHVFKHINKEWDNVLSMGQNEGLLAIINGAKSYKRGKAFINWLVA